MAIQTFYTQAEAQAVADPKVVVAYSGTYIVYSGSDLATPPVNPAEGQATAVDTQAVTPTPTAPTA